MPKRAIIIRHGESFVNTDKSLSWQAAFDAAPLTETGKQQAEISARNFPFAPDIIITSSLARARETAGFLSLRYPGVPVEVWAVHEMYFSAPDAIWGHDAFADFEVRLYEYFEQLDVTRPMNPGGESFLDALQRARQFLQSVEYTPHEYVAVFSHGRFMRIIEAFLQDIGQSPKDVMRTCWGSLPIQNGNWLELLFDDNGRITSVHRISLAN